MLDKWLWVPSLCKPSKASLEKIHQIDYVNSMHPLGKLQFLLVNMDLNLIFKVTQALIVYYIPVCCIKRVNQDPAISVLNRNWS